MIPRLAWPSQILIPGDKSISHRMLIMSAMSEGTSVLKGLSEGQDVQRTKQILKELGFFIQTERDVTTVQGQGFRRWEYAIDKVLDCGNSGTTARHILAMVSGGDGCISLTGDQSLCSRPMGRIADPLRRMGAKITLTPSADRLPALVVGQVLNSISHELLVPSAQVKSSLILTACNSKVPIRLSGRLEGRDHTENLIPFFGGDLQKSHVIDVPVQKPWSAVQYHIPKDPSAVANWMAAAILTEREVVFENVLLNPSRMGFVNALMSMGANIHIDIQQSTPEPVGVIHIKPSKLKGCVIDYPTSHFVDEAPLLALLASQATGTTVIKDLSELRFKECDRFQVTQEILMRLGVHVDTKDDSWIIRGPQKLNAASLDTYDDHRMSMLGLIAGMVVPVHVDNLNSLKVSDPYMADLVC